MSTRSYIGMVQKDGTVKAIYCHHDGYVEGVGATLQKAYRSSEKIEKLISLGSLSVLGEEIGEKAPSFERQKPSYCLSYHRDRGDDLDILEYTHAVEFFGEEDLCIEYRYLWDGRLWWMYGSGRPLQALEQALRNEKTEVVG